MVCGIILEEGTILNEMVLISTFVTIIALDGLNVTMCYCIRFDLKSKALIFCFWSSSSAILKMSCRFEILWDLSLFLICGFFIPLVKFVARIVLAGSVGVRVCACSTKSVKLWNVFMHGQICLPEFGQFMLGHCGISTLWKFFPVREVSLQPKVCLMNEALSHILWSDLLEVARATLSGPLPETPEILLTSSNHILKSSAILPSHDLALLR